MKKFIYFILMLMCNNTLLISQTSKYLTTSEVFSIMEKSKLNYNINSMDSLSAADVEKYTQNLYMQKKQHVEYPFVVKSDSNISLYSFKFDSLAWNEILKGEEYYSKNDYKNALIYYENAIKISDNCYLAYLDAGDCYLELGNPTKALDYYERAKKINPYDYRCYFYCGTADIKLGKYSEAKDNDIYALSLKPNHKNILLVLEKLSSILSIKVHDLSFNPKGGINETSKGIDIYVSMENNGIWMPYIFAKAILKYEPKIRQKYIGSKETRWNIEEEKQALYCMLSSYDSMRQEGKIPPNKYLEKLTEIFKNGDWGSFIMYEISSKMTPDVVLLLPETFRSDIERFIRKYIITDS